MVYGSVFASFCMQAFNLCSCDLWIGGDCKRHEKFKLMSQFELST
jgi:hypothetical protein